MTVKILLVEDHELVRLGLRRALEGVSHWDIIGETGNGNDAIAMAARLMPDLVLLDMNLPGAHGLDVLRAVKKRCPHIKVVVLTGFPSPYLVRAARSAGAEGFVLKDLPWKNLVQVLELVLSGEEYIQESVAPYAVSDPNEMVEQLTTRERQVLKLISRGMGNRAISETLGILKSTVDSHVRSILGKVGADNRVEAVDLARQSGLLR